ncbi:MAG: hypothetical protein KDC92_06775, partial [Bacteroidetes bacterium]|nr:hypothetical protein [Bacteroidota bacterium]
MKRAILWALPCLFLTIKMVNAQPNHHHHNMLGIKVQSQEQNNWVNALNINLQLMVHDTITFTDSACISNPGFGYSFTTFNLKDSTYLPGDTVSTTITLNFDTTYVPESYLKISLKQAYSHFGDSTKSKTQFVIYFTPWRTIEVWNSNDFASLNRVWTESTDTSTKVFIYKDSVPASDIPDTFVVQYDWQDHFYDVFIDGLPYSIPMMAIHPDSLTQADTNKANKKPTLFRFNGVFEGNIRGIFDIDNSATLSERGLAGLTVELWNVGGVIPIATTTTDLNGDFTEDF